jgi:predicted PurR-regulated permease PerM
MISIYDILNIISTKIKKTFWFLGLHAFSLIIFLVFIGIILGGFVFYKYVFVATNDRPNTAGNILKFDEKKYQNILKELQQNVGEMSSVVIQPASSTKIITPKAEE